jgi:tetratricopeptide (TPR) repeat protein
VRKIILTSLLALLSGCQTLSPGLHDKPQAAAVEKPVVLPFAEPAPTGGDLSAEMVFDYLVGEIGARRGDFATALDGYLGAAEEAHDAYAAERATRLALHMGDLDTAREAAALWVQAAPNSEEARKLYAVLLLRKGYTEEAFSEFQAMRRIDDAQGKDGLLQVVVVLAGEPDHDAARTMFGRLVADHPDTPESLYAGALLDAAQDRHAQAEAALDKVLSAKPDSPEARVLLSRVLVAGQRTDAALEVLAKGLAYQPDNPLLLNSYARLLVALGKYEQALQQFRDLHRQSPDDLTVTYGYAMLASQQEAWDEARGLWQELRNEPKFYAEATYFLAQIEEATDHPQLALGLYRSVNKGPLVADAAIRAASLMQRLGQIDAARTLLQDARKGNAKRAVDLYLAEAQLMQLAKAPAADILSVYGEALKTNPDNLDLLYNRGLYYSELGDYPSMERDFRAVLKLDPHNVNALNALGYMLAEQNIRLQEARGYVEEALQRNPDSAAILDSMGWVLYRLGEFEAAREKLEQAYAKDADAEIAAHLIEVLWASGDKQAARSLLRSASEKAQDSPYLSTLRERLLTDGQ